MPTTKKRSRASNEPRAEYDFSNGVRGKYAARFKRETNVVVLAADVASAFKTSKAVNQALRSQLNGQPTPKRRPKQR
jgi:hypothetical protein